MSKLYNIQYCKSFAKKKNGKCLSSEYVNTKKKLRWQCKKHHVWEASFDNIKNQKTWCPTCHHDARSRQLRNSIHEVRSIVKQKKGTLLTKTYKNNRQLLKVSCFYGHIWNIRYYNIKQGYWCPLCSKKPQKKQKLLYDIIKKIYKRHQCFYNFREFKWMGKQEIDIFVRKDNFSLAIEYDGEQHFKPIKMWGGESRLRKQKKSDKLKNKLISMHPEDVKYFIRFNYKDTITLESVKKKLAKVGALN